MDNAPEQALAPAFRRSLAKKEALKLHFIGLQKRETTVKVTDGKGNAVPGVRVTCKIEALGGQACGKGG